MDWATLAAVAAIVFGAVGLQSSWIARELDDIKARIADIKGTLEPRVTRLEERPGGSGLS